MSGGCTSGTDASFDGYDGQLGHSIFTITNDGTSATGTLEATGFAAFQWSAGKVTLEPGASAHVDYMYRCFNAGTFQDTATISDPISGASITLTTQVVCYCTPPYHPCTTDSDCCPRAGGVRCNPTLGCV